MRGRAVWLWLYRIAYARDAVFVGRALADLAVPDIRIWDGRLWFVGHQAWRFAP
jgi:hypothetical protein